MTHTFSTKPIETRDNEQITLGRIGHATVLINFFGTWIITDPVFAMCFGVPIGHTRWNVGAWRLRKPQIKIHELPPIDIILLSHGHMDHLHPWSCKKILKNNPGNTQIICAPGNKQWLSQSIKEQSIELDWCQNTEIAGVHIISCEVKHWGGRYPWVSDRSKGQVGGSSYNAYLLEKNGKRIFFGGDTAYTDAMKSYAPVGGVDIAIMPIGSYDPRIRDHCNPEQSLEMAEMIGARNIVGIHWDSRGWPYKKREFDNPLKRFLESSHKYNMNVLWKHEGEVVILS